MGAFKVLNWIDQMIFGYNIVARGGTGGDWGSGFLAVFLPVKAFS